MRRWIALAAQCYPRAWRERYGVEFDALMEDVEPDWREFTNVLGGAVKLQLQRGTAVWKPAGLMALVGMLVAIGVSRIAPQRYVSTAQVRVTPAPGATAEEVALDMETMLQQTLNRSSLVEMIGRPSLSLYRGERERVPMEDVVQEMRRNILVRLEGPAGSTFSVSFAYPDRFKAQAVVRELTRRFLEQNVAVARNRENLWQDVWHEEAPPGGKMELAVPASEPREPESRLANFLGWGLGVGLMLGLLVFPVLRHPRLMRQLALYGLTGCAIGGAASFLMPEVFVSEVVMRITPPVNPARWYAGTKPEPFLERVERLKNSVWDTLKNGSQRNIGIELFPTTLTAGTIRVSATAGSAIQAQSLLREVVSGFLEQYIIEEQTRKGDEIRYMAEHRLGPHIEVLDPPSLPQTSASPNRAVMAELGLLAGVLVGVAMAWHRRPRGPAITGAMAQPI